MTQNAVDFSDNPTGAGLMDDYLDKDQQNVLTSNSGIQRPSYAVAGTKWLDTSATPWVLKMYDGTDDVALGTVNPTTHAFVPYGVDSKQDIANLSQILDTSTTKYPSNNAVKTAIDAKDSLPSQAGNAGKFLTTDGTTASWNNAVDYTNITNCITENPELVKLSLSGGTLTLEAGSTVIVPYGKSAPTMAIGDSLNGGTISDISWDGTLLFYYVRYDSAKTFGSYHNGSSICFLNCIGGTGTLGPISLMHSGTIAPTTTQYMLWYDTNNNIVKYTSDTGSTWTNYQSLVFAIASGTGGASSSAWTSIEQTFQSIGYIGSTVYALPGVKGLIPNGRNADGSLRNIEFTTDTVLITTNSGSTDTRNIILSGNSIDHPGTSGYNEISNIVWKDNGIVVNDMIAGQAVYTSGKVTSFTPKTAFHAVDRNDSSWVAQQAMPSNKYIDLTLGATGSTYIAPANGWFYLEGQGQASFAGWIEVDVKINGVMVYRNGRYTSTSNTIKMITPVIKGAQYVVRFHLGSGSLNLNRFIYAEGEN